MKPSPFLIWLALLVAAVIFLIASVNAGRRTVKPPEPVTVVATMYNPQVAVFGPSNTMIQATITDVALDLCSDGTVKWRKVVRQ